MLESLGALTIVGIGVLLFFRMIENKDEAEIEKKQFIKHSWSCKILTQDYYLSVKKGEPIMT